MPNRQGSLPLSPKFEEGTEPCYVPGAIYVPDVEPQARMKTRSTDTNGDTTSRKPARANNANGPETTREKNEKMQKQKQKKKIRRKTLCVIL